MKRGRKPRLIGIDTGFVYALRDGNPEAIRVWREEENLVVPTIVLYELKKKALRGELASEFVDSFTGAVNVMPLTEEAAMRAAGIAHGTGIPGLDSLILGTLIEAGCDLIYTRDPHFKRYHREGVSIVLL